MFKFLKKKLKESVKSFSKDAEKEAQEVQAQELSESEKELLEQEEQASESSEAEEQKTEETEEQAEEKKEEDKKEFSQSKKDELDKKPPEKEPAQKPEEKKEETKQDKKNNEKKPDQEEAEQEVEPSEEDKAIEEEYEGKKKGFFGRVFGKKEKKEEAEEEPKAEEQEVELSSSSQHPVEQKPEPRPQEKAQQNSSQHPVEQTSEPSDQTIATSEAEEQTSESSKAESRTKSTDRSTQSTEQPSEHGTQSTDKQTKAAVHEDLFEEKVTDSTKKKKGFFSKLKGSVTKFQLTEEKFDELFWEFELALLENNVAMEVIEKIKTDMKEKLTQENVSRRGIESVILSSLNESLEHILNIEPVNLIKRVNEKKPFIITVVGVNGSGKTTTIGKLIKLFQNNDLSVVVAAADTFRAAAIQQLEQHTNNLGVTLIKQDYNSDAAAVAFDAVQHAKAKDIDVVLIDTAGRLQSNRNLMDELSKVIRVNKPDFNLFVGEAITGNDCVEQAVQFDEAVGIDGIILSKADIDDKGGAAISISYVTQKPILYLGVGQTYEDLEPFTKERILEHLGLDDDE
ncbi:MAG: signal recognition particle-docking protein FtsY [Nanobdellota archaeon]